MLCYNSLSDDTMPSPPAPRPQRRRAFLKPDHDHGVCAASALAAAESLCQTRGVRLTTVRRKILGLIWQSHAPVGAYDLLARLNRGGGKVAPITVYRALDFLMAQGLVHRIASLNAYIGCAHVDSKKAGHDHAAQFLICKGCGSAAELESPALRRALARAVSGRGFTIDQQIVEISGLCPHCKGA
jgi:Fur family zinc uptake transcriptional regulator